MAIGDILGGIGKGVSKIGRGVTDTLGFTTERVKGATLTDEEKRLLGRRYNPNDAAYQPDQNVKFTESYDASKAFAQDQVNALNDPNAMRDGAMSGPANPANTYAAPTVGAGALGPMDQVRTDAGIGAANSMLGQSNMSRDGQVGQLSYLDQVQRGEGPSAARDMAAGHAAEAAGAFAQNAQGAVNAYGQAANTAQGAYGDANANQMQQNLAAARNSAQALQAAGDRSVLNQASLAAGARGGGMGAALRNSMQNNALSAQATAGQQGQIMQSATLRNMDAATNAARAGSNANNQSSLAGLNAQAMGDINAGRAWEAGMRSSEEALSREQLGAMGLYTDAGNTVRAQDIGAVGAATGVAGVASGADNSAAGYAVGDLDRQLSADTTNLNSALNTNQLNENASQAWAQDSLARDQGNQTNVQVNKGRASSAAIESQQLQNIMAMTGMTMEQALEVLKSNNFGDSLGREMQLALAELGIQAGANSEAFKQKGKAQGVVMDTAGSAFSKWAGMS